VTNGQLAFPLEEAPCSRTRFLHGPCFSGNDAFRMNATNLYGWRCGSILLLWKSFHAILGLFQNHGNALNHFLILHQHIQYLSGLSRDRALLHFNKQIGETTPIRSSKEAIFANVSTKPIQVLCKPCARGSHPSLSCNPLLSRRN